MSIFQVSAVFFALFMLYVISIHRRKKIISALEASLWYSTWSFFIAVAIFPDLLLGIADALRFARIFDMLIVVALMILTVVVFTSHFQIIAARKKIEEVARSIATKSMIEKNKKGQKKK